MPNSVKATVASSSRPSTQRQPSSGNKLVDSSVPIRFSTTKLYLVVKLGRLGTVSGISNNGSSRLEAVIHR